MLGFWAGNIQNDPVCKKSFNYGPFAYMVRIPARGGWKC